MLLSPKFTGIDRTFVPRPHRSTHNDSLLETIMSLGSQLVITMLAEGIETHGQLERLRDLGCELGQGFLFSKVVPGGQVAAMLSRVPGSQCE